jgi:uncharacterized protein (DUF1499 family)
MIGKATIALALSAIACMIAGPGLTQIDLVGSRAGVALFTLSGPLGLAALLAAIVSALRFKAYFPALVGMLGCLPLVAVTAGLLDSLRYPPINDIATDTASVPEFVHAPSLPELAGHNWTFPRDNAALIAAHYPDLQPLRLDEPALQVHQRARAVATSKHFAWTITHEFEQYSGFEANAETRLFRWKDDVVVRIRPAGDRACIVDIRSRSRGRTSDLGANARRIRRFLDALQE